MMIGRHTLLVMLVQLVTRLPLPPPRPNRGRGRPRFYPDHLFLQALVVMIVRHLHTVNELLTVLDQPTAEMQTLRALLTERERFPTRRTWERRLAALPGWWRICLPRRASFLVIVITTRRRWRPCACSASASW